MAEKDEVGLKQAATQAAKVDEETARLEVSKFLDLKRVPEIRRKRDFEASIEVLESLVVSGDVTFDFEAKRTHVKLLVPVKSQSGDIKSLKLRFYLGAQESDIALKKIDQSDGMGRTLAIVATLSGNNLNVLKNNENDLGEKGLDVGDSNRLIHYATFFLG